MHHLARRVHAGIGAAGALHARAFAAEAGERLLQRLLHGAPRLLPLPADIGAAVIFDNELVARHGDHPSAAKAAA